MNFGVSCTCILPPTDSKDSSSSSEDHSQLLVGYQSGYIENWRIFRFSSEKILAKMMWRGMYPNHETIQNIAPLNIMSNMTSSSTKEDDELEEAHEKSNLNGKADNPDDSSSTAKHHPASTDNPAAFQSPKPTVSPKKIASYPNYKATPQPSPAKIPPTSMGAQRHQYLVVTLWPTHEAPPTTSAMLDVIHIGSLAADWKSKKEPHDPGMGIFRAIKLEKRWVMPATEMELLNSMAVAHCSHGTHQEDHGSGCLPRKVHVIPSVGTGCICKLLWRGVAWRGSVFAMPILSSLWLQSCMFSHIWWCKVFIYYFYRRTSTRELCSLGGWYDCFAFIHGRVR